MKNFNTYYTGVVVEVINSETYEIRVDIPGINQNMTAYPVRSEIDEPRVNDLVLLKNLDPTFQSYLLYQKIKENDFVGIRSNGKMIDITPEYIQITTFDKIIEYSDSNDSDYKPEPLDWIKLDESGNLDVKLRGGANLIVEGEGGISLNVSSQLDVTINGDATVKVTGNTQLESENITLIGNTEINGGSFKLNGAPTPSNLGPLNCIPICPFSGAMHAGNFIPNTD